MSRYVMITGLILALMPACMGEKSQSQPTIAPLQQTQTSPAPAPAPTLTEPTPLSSQSTSPATTASPVSINLPVDTRLGVTYSFPHSQWLFDGDSGARQALQQIANLGIKRYRLEAYWDWLQDDSPDALKTSYNLDWQLAITNTASADTVIMCLGRKVPHYPEFHLPNWAKNLTESVQQQKLLAYEGKLIDVYATDRRITHWQVENEVFFDFGTGKAYTNQEDFLNQEIATIRAHDALHRPIIITESGDKGDWTHAAAGKYPIFRTVLSLSKGVN